MISFGPLGKICLIPATLLASPALACSGCRDAVLDQVYGAGFAATLFTVGLPVVAVICVACGVIAWRNATRAP